jgi:hypothetical protein
MMYVLYRTHHSCCGRLENACNSYRLFYGIFFAESSLAKRHIQSRASSVVSKRSNTLEGNRQSILRKIKIEMSSVKIARASVNVAKRVNAAATHDLLHHMRGHVIADQIKQFRQRQPSMPLNPPPHSGHGYQRTNGSFANKSIRKGTTSQFLSFSLFLLS